MTRYVVLGAGAIGCSIGARLVEAGRDVVLVARGSQLGALRSDGLRLLTPDGPLRVSPPAVGGPAELQRRPDDVVLLCVKSQDTLSTLGTWADWIGDAPVFCVQNGVANEAAALRFVPRVHAVCVYLACTFTEPGTVAQFMAPRTGVLTLGSYPSGVGDTDRSVAADLAAARIAAPVVEDPMRWKYGKLLRNLANGIDALCGRSGVDELVRDAQAEGRAVLTAAGIAFVDDAEDAAARGDLVGTRDVPGVGRGGSSSWQSLARGTGTIETDWLNGEIVALGRRQGVATPVNDAVQRLARRAARDGTAAGSLDPAALRDAAGTGSHGVPGPWGSAGP